MSPQNYCLQTPIEHQRRFVIDVPLTKKIDDAAEQHMRSMLPRECTISTFRTQINVIFCRMRMCCFFSSFQTQNIYLCGICRTKKKPKKLCASHWQQRNASSDVFSINFLLYCVDAHKLIESNSVVTLLLRKRHMYQHMEFPSIEHYCCLVNLESKSHSDDI